MKKITLYFLSVVFLLSISLNPVKGYCQSSDGEIGNVSVVSGGVGFSLVGILFSAIESVANNITGSDFGISHTPVLALNYDYVIKGKFSLGAAASYQSFSTSYTNYQYTSNGQMGSATWKDKLVRTNYAIRPLFHFGKGEELDLYLGARIGMTAWGYSTNHPDPYYSTLEFYDFNQRVSIQVLFGARYYFTDFLGFNTEFGIGAPYYAMFGLSAKF